MLYDLDNPGIEFEDASEVPTLEDSSRSLEEQDKFIDELLQSSPAIIKIMPVQDIKIVEIFGDN